MLKQPIYYEFNLDARTSPSKLIAISHVDDKYSEVLEVAVKQNNRFVYMGGATVIARMVLHRDKDYLLSDDVACSVNDNGNIMIPFDNAVVKTSQGVVKIEVNITRDADELTLQFPLWVSVTGSILDNAEVTPESKGTIPDLLKDAADALEDATEALEQLGSYSNLEDKPQINGVTLSGNKTSGELGLQKALTAGDHVNIDVNGNITITGIVKYADGADGQAGTNGELAALDSNGALKRSGVTVAQSVGAGSADKVPTTEAVKNALFDATNTAFNRFDSTVQGASSTNTSNSIYLKTGETAKITISDFDGTLATAFIKGHLSPSLPIYRDGVYKFTAQYDGLLTLYGVGTTTFIADVELMTLAAVRLENTQAQADSNTLEIDALKDAVFPFVNGDVEQGSYDTAGGGKQDTDRACRTASYTPQTALRAVFNDGIKAGVRAFDINGNYVGGYTGSGFSTDYTQFAKLDSPIALRDFTAEYGYNWKLAFIKSAGGNIVPNDVGLQYEVSAIPDETEIYTVGTNGDFSGFTEMLIALASNSKEKIVYVYGGVYDIFDEMGGAEYISSIENASSLSWRGVNHIVPPNTTIIGVGKVILEWNPSDSEIIDQNHAFLFSPLNLSGSCTIKNIEIRCSNCRYGIHDETGGRAVFNGTTRVLDNVRVYFTASTYGVHYAYGAGHNKNSKYIYNNCVFSAAYGIAWSSHDWPATEYENSTFEFNNCIFKNNLPTSPSGKAGIRFSSSATDSRQDIVKINGCDFNSIIFGTEGSGSVKQGYTVTTMLCPSFTVTYTDRIASEDRIAPTVYLSVGPQGAPGNDYVLTEQDKADIADIVLQELPTTQGVLYGNTSN